VGLKSSVLSIGFVIAAGGAGPSGSLAEDGRKPACLGDAMVVLDGSGSMAAADFPEGAPNRIDRVRLALSRVVPDAAAVRRLGLVIYGPGKSERSCRHVDLKFSPRPQAARDILQFADQMRPAGRTPLTRSVAVAVQALRDSPRPAEIVVLTDGEDTCGGDPCDLARRLKVEAPGIRVHVVGFRLPSYNETAGAKCLATETGGMFVTAETTSELTDALRQTLVCAGISQSTPRVDRWAGTTGRLKIRTDPSGR
jgi:Ca-activated chloride channel family protein